MMRNWLKSFVLWPIMVDASVGGLNKERYNYIFRKMKIDVVLITYNQQNYVSAAVESILKQELPDGAQMRLVVADDCSSDGTIEVIKRCTDNSGIETVFLPSERNLGIEGNYKKAMAAIDADYVAILEGDDYWCDAKRLEKHIGYLESHPCCAFSTNAILLFDDIRKTYRHGRGIDRDRCHTLSDMIVNYGIVDNLSSCVFNSRYLKKIDDVIYDLSKQIGIVKFDELFVFSILKGGGYAFAFQEVMSVYRVETGNNISRVDWNCDFEQEQHKKYCKIANGYLDNNFDAEFANVHAQKKNEMKRKREQAFRNKYGRFLPPFLVEFLLWLPDAVSWFKHLVWMCIPRGLYRKK